MKRAIDALFPRIRQGILAATLLKPARWWYLSDLAKHLQVRPSSLQRELATLVAAGVLLRRKEGNRVFVQPNTDCPFLSELTGLLTKTAGLVDVLEDVLASFAQRIRCAFVYGSLARAEERADSDVDLMVIGEAGLAELTPVLRRVESRLGRAVNATVYAQAKFAKKATSGHHFLREVLARDKPFVPGRADYLARTVRRPARPAT